MTYAASETAFLADQGFSDLRLAYPTVRTCDLALLAQVNDRGTTAAVVVDCIAHLAALEKEAAGAKIPVVIEVDLSYRPIERVHLGVRRSPLRSVEEVVALAERIGGFPHLAFHGLMGY
jgi:D-serine deaminase-like pyridoxal phosphate-dependent protein